MTSGTVSSEGQSGRGGADGAGAAELSFDEGHVLDGQQGDASAFTLPSNTHPKTANHQLFR